jgi:hypothetical protein
MVGNEELRWSKSGRGRGLDGLIGLIESQEFHNLYCYIRVMELGQRERWADHAAHG